MMIPIYPPKVFKIISSISQNLYGIKPWINSTPKVIINTAKRALVLFFSNLMYIKNPKGINTATVSRHCLPEKQLIKTV